ncbi:sensor histidine kinase [Nonomuraea sp. LPB2021202275-12-8]|uniref:sensor histidine kinase n=1 Tax=Nonomuraea sp. LPB2021202275-12-8 TaxID=3120159 RepID=UPI00300C78D0
MLADHLRPPDGKPYGPPDAKGLLAFVLLGVAAVWDTAIGASRPAWLAWSGLAAAAALYMAAVLLAFRGRTAPATASLAALAAVVTVMAARFGEGWLYLFPMVGIACGTVLYGRRVQITLLALTAVTALVVWDGGGNVETIMAFAWGTFSAGIVAAFILHLHALIGELRDTRQRLAEAAVAEERLRFARDLHDLLGHTLSVIVVKAEAVRRLAPSDPGQVQRQAADIETVGRQALAEVREAVTGYRTSSLDGELNRAADTLRTAGVEPVVSRTGAAPGGQAQTLLGWVVREGVTNVIRHSGATRAEITLAGQSVTITDNGPATSAGEGGSGLRGLAERLSQAGGTVEAGPLPQGGWRLAASIPETAD